MFAILTSYNIILQTYIKFENFVYLCIKIIVMKPNVYFEDPTIRPSDFQIAAANQQFIVKVYGWMCFALAITGFVSLFVCHFTPLIKFFLSNTALFFGLCIAEVVLVFVLAARVNKMSLFSCALCFILYSVLNGITLAPIFLIYTQSSIATTFFILSGTFAAMSLFGYFTKQDLTRWGNILIMVLLGVIVATLINLFVHNTAIYWITTYAGVFIFVGLIAYDTQKLKEMNMMGIEDSEMGRKVAIMGALTLYLDFINLFIYLLRIFGKER